MCTFNACPALHIPYISYVLLKKKISAALKPHLKQGETVKLSAKVDPSLLGGLTVQIGDKYLDLSAATKIGAISRAL